MLGAVAAAAMGLGLLDVLPRWPGLVHAVALPPLDMAFDLRILVARAHTWPAFAVGAALSVLLRAALLAIILGPGRADVGFARRYRAALRLYVGALVPLAVAAGLEFAGLAAVYAWYVWVGLALTAAAVLLGSRRLARVAGRAKSAWPRGLWFYLVALVLIGAAARSGAWASVVLVAPSAMLTWWTMRGSVPLRRRRHAATAAVLAVLQVPFAAPIGAEAQRPARPVLLLIPGVDTSSGYGALYRLDPAGIGFPCERVYYYSYLGPKAPAPRAPKDRTATQGEAPCPIRLHAPYVPEDTQRPLAELTAALAAQMGAIGAATGGAPVVVVTHSQGAAIAWQALATGQISGVSHLITLAGFARSPVGYPPPGVAGEGRVGADVLRALSWVSRTLAVGTFDPDGLLARELLANPNGLESVFAQPLPEGIRTATVFTSFDVAAAPEGQTVPGVPAAIIDSTHAGIVGSPDAGIAARSVLAGRVTLGLSPVGTVLQWVVPAFLPPPSDPPAL